jgi:rhomboid protease GluP
VSPRPVDPGFQVPHTFRSGWWPLAIVTLLTLAVLVVAFLTSMALDPAGYQASGRISIEALTAFGIKDDARVLAGHPAGLVRAGLVHLTWTHLIVNGVGLAFCATLLWRLVREDERTFGRAALIPVIVVIASSFGFVLSFLLRNGLSAGASAGVFGLLGAVPGALWTRPDLAPLRTRSALALVLLALGAAAVALLSGDGAVDHAAHAGGLATGFVCGGVIGSVGGRRGLVLLAVVFIAIGFTPA